MADKDVWEKMVNGREEAIESLWGDIEDQAVVYAAGRIKELERDIEILTLRLIGEEDRTHSPETNEVLSRWIPVIAKKHNIRI